jgi:hypothetical protein
LKAVTLEDFGENENFPNECCVSWQYCFEKCLFNLF